MPPKKDNKVTIDKKQYDEGMKLIKKVILGMTLLGTTQSIIGESCGELSDERTVRSP